MSYFQTLTDAARDACHAEGVEFRDVPADGGWHEADLIDDPRGRGDGRIKLFPDGRGGLVHNWKASDKPRVFFVDDGRTLSEAERKQREQERRDAIKKAEQEVQREREQAATWAAALWEAATVLHPNHPYYARKLPNTIPPDTLREIPAEQAAAILGYQPKSNKSGREPLAGRLILAPVKVGGKLSTLELIDEAGRKAALYGSGTKPGGCYWAAQPLPEGDGASSILAIGEGVSTVLSVRYATDHHALAALAAANIPKVAQAMREQLPAARLLILGDLGNGQDKAERAARETGAALALPTFTPEQIQAFQAEHGKPPTDFNDLHQIAGADEVRRQVAAALDAGTHDPAEPAQEAAPEPFLPKPQRRKKRNRPTASDDGRSVIRIIGGTLPEQIEKAEAALITNGTEVYQRNGEIVRPVRLGSEINGSGVFIPSGAMTLGPVDKHWTMKAMTVAARFEKYDSRSDDFIPTDCPMKVAETYLSSAGEWKIPPIVGISECPTMRRDDSLILKSGYDRKSGIFVDYHGPEVSVIENPTRQDALQALEILKEPFREFPFASEESHSVALSGALTCVIRRSLRTAPMHAFDAPAKGSGKGLLADSIAMIATGRTAAMVSQGRDEAEDEKRLSAMLMRSAPVICIDNIERNVQGDFLCSMLTQEVVTARVLGFSKMLDLPSNSLILATGNNMVFMGDMTRRVLPCRIDPQCERPDARRFAVNLREWVPANRHRLIGAALTILRAYHVAGRPAQDFPPYGSFEEWSDLVRSALVWLGCADPCLTRESLERNDPITAELSAVLPLWRAAFGTEGKTTAEVAEACTLSAHANLKHALLEVAASARNPDAIDPKRLGKWLKKYEKRVHGGLRIEKAGEDSHSKIAFWRVAQIAGSAGFAGSGSNPTRETVNIGSSHDGVKREVTNILGWPETNPANPALPAKAPGLDNDAGRL